jgi:DNA-directed RNA polymerase subunit beta'
VIGPDLGLHQCGLPKKMALVLFEPFIIRRLKEMGLVHTVRSAKKMIERRTPEVWDILDEVTKGHPSFSTVRLLSTVCPSRRLSQSSSKVKPSASIPSFVRPTTPTSMVTRWLFTFRFPSKHRWKPASSCWRRTTCSPLPAASPITTPSQDIPLGCYFLTYLREFPSPDAKKSDVPERLPTFNDVSEVEFAFSENQLAVNDKIRFRNPDYKQPKRIFGDPEKPWIETTAGRVRFNEIWPETLGFINETSARSRSRTSSGAASRRSAIAKPSSAWTA